MAQIAVGAAPSSGLCGGSCRVGERVCLLVRNCGLSGGADGMDGIGPRGELALEILVETLLASIAAPSEGVGPAQSGAAGPAARSLCPVRRQSSRARYCPPSRASSCLSASCPELPVPPNGGRPPPSSHTRRPSPTRTRGAGRGETWSVTRAGERGGASGWRRRGPVSAGGRVSRQGV